MRPLVALLGFASLGACLTSATDVDNERLMPTWEEFDDYLHAQGQTNNRFKRDFPFEYFNEGRSSSSSTNGLAATLDALDATVDRKGLVANAIDSVGDRLRQKDYIGAISNFANKLRGSGRPRQDLLFNVPQTSVPQIIVDLAAFGPVITFGYAFARDLQMQDDINNLKDRIKKMTDANPTTLKGQLSTLCAKVTELTSAQGCDTAGPTCDDTIANPDWFIKANSLINKLIAVGDPTCSA